MSLRKHVWVCSRAKLTEMVIRVQVRPSYPRHTRHPAEDGMLRPLGILRAGRYSFEQHLQLRDIGFEVGRTSARSLLIDFGPRDDPGRPPQRQIQRGPFHDELRQWASCGAHSHLPECHAARVAEMTDHLMRGHPAPETSAVRAHCSQALKDLGPAAVARERLHRDAEGPQEPISRSPPASRNAARARCGPLPLPPRAARNAACAAQRVELRTCAKRWRHVVPLGHRALQIDSRPAS